MEFVINIFLLLLAIYAILGILFGLYFLLGAAVKLDPIMGDSKWIVRLLLFPGVVAVWPFLIYRLLKSKAEIR